MAYIGESQNTMRPSKNDSTIKIPITFDYNGGRKEATKSRYIWSAVVGVVGLIIGIGIMTSSDGFFLINIPLGLLFIFGVILVIRFPILKEHKVRENMVSLLDSDYKRDYDYFWGLYSIEDMYPYYCHFRNGRQGIFVQFEKDVIVGKIDDAEYEHYEAIADAYNLAGGFNIKMCHIDYMANIGSDDRLVECFNSLTDIDNEDIKDIMTDIYTHVQGMMLENVTNFDVYVFTFNSSEQSFMNNMQKIFGCMLEANYISFRILNSNDLRDLAISLFNINDLSVVDASTKAFKSNRKSGVIPIRVINSLGEETILNKTQEEKAEERKLREKEQRLKKEEVARRKKSKKEKKKNRRSKDIVNDDSDEIDLF